MHTDITIDPDATVNDIIAQHPASIAVLNQFGVDSCCGGGETLRAAAQHSGVDLDALIAELQRAVSTP